MATGKTYPWRCGSWKPMYRVEMPPLRAFTGEVSHMGKKIKTKIYFFIGSAKSVNNTKKSLKKRERRVVFFLSKSGRTGCQTASGLVLSWRYFFFFFFWYIIMVAKRHQVGNSIKNTNTQHS